MRRFFKFHCSGVERKYFYVFLVNLMKEMKKWRIFPWYFDNFVLYFEEILSELHD